SNPAVPRSPARSCCLGSSPRSTIRKQHEARSFAPPRPPEPPPSPSTLAPPIVAVARLLELTRRLTLRDANSPLEHAAAPAAVLGQPSPVPSTSAPRAAGRDGARSAARVSARRGGGR